ncbi:hypothetical protein NESM_000221900 [Novymonas esmeraldas]|uniref:Uncharacterized protein n=1 Tax=Novymonas esmeraldas TaxID=1808958 RepID=A0AAW0F927_9TRYP
MGLVPSRESLYETGQGGSPARSLPFISRAVENYVYKTNRTERVFGGGGSGALAPAALLDGAPTTELALKITATDPGAVFIDDPAEATAAVAASRGSRRGPPKVADAHGRGRGGGGGGGGGGAALETPAAEALRLGKVPYVYYYEHRVVPLTAEYFPSPDCVLFRQLWRARQQQNPRYHFQLDHTWSPGALTDPTASYESFDELAAHNMIDIQAACLTSGKAVTPESIAHAQARLHAATCALAAGGGARIAGRDGATSGAAGAWSQRTRVPFSTRGEFYELVVRTTEERMLYNTNAQLRDAVCGTATAGDAPSGRHAGDGEAEPRRLRPVPCVVVLVRRCMPAHEYRHTYFVANTERHHKCGAAAGTSNANRRRGGNVAAAAAAVTAGAGGEAHAPLSAQRLSHSTHVSCGSVLAAVRRADAVDRARQAAVDEEEVVVPWLQVSLPQAPLGLAELRVVGMYGCWTVEEVLQSTLFSPAPSRTSSYGPVMAGRPDSSEHGEPVGKLLRRAAPHGVPSSTLLNTAFFEKQVGDKEQCHTYFALCRLFAHGLRECLLGTASGCSPAAPRTATGHAGVLLDASLREREEEAAEEDETAAAAAAAATAAKQQHADPVWQALMNTLAGDAGAASCVGDLANCFLIRFSNIPQLQLCRQIRLMLTELGGMYPAPPSLEGFQAAQRQRNLAAMAKKSDTSGAAAGGGAGAGRSAAGSPSSTRNGDSNSSTAPPSPQAAGKNVHAEPVAAVTASAQTKSAGPASCAPAAVRAGRSAGVSLALDPEAIAQRPHQVSERERLERDGFCCYASYGLVVFRLSRVAVAHALHQLSCTPLHDSIEALCVTLTAAAPPPLTYRGELRPPARLQPAVSTAAQTDAGVENTGTLRASVGVGTGVCAEEEQRAGVQAADISDAERRRYGEESGVVLRSAEGQAAEALENMYNNAVRYSAACETGFAMQPLWPLRPDRASWATRATALEDTPDELIGVLPRNSIEQRRGRLLPIHGPVSPDRSQQAGAAAQHLAYIPGSSVPPQQRHGSSTAATSFQLDVYSVSAELDGMPFRELVELTHQEYQYRRQCAASGATQDNTPSLIIESVDAQGNVEPDSVLNWSPMAALGCLRWHRALSTVGCGPGGPGRERGPGAGEGTGARDDSPTSLGGLPPPGAVTILVHEPERVLRTGDRIRFSPYRSPGDGGGTSTAGEHSSPESRAEDGTVQQSRGGGGGGPQQGYWYVDDSLTTEDMILSWMRRVGGRARETRGMDTKWVRFPEHVLQVLLRFSHTCREEPGGGWLTTGQALRPLHPTDEELVEPDLLQNYPDILRTRRFRQWRFSHDGYVYFHGVTVRIPGSAPQASHTAHAATAGASTTAAGGQRAGEAAERLPAGRFTAGPPNQRVAPAAVMRHTMQHVEAPPPSSAAAAVVQGGVYGSAGHPGGLPQHANEVLLQSAATVHVSGGGPARHEPSAAPQNPHALLPPSVEQHKHQHQHQEQQQQQQQQKHPQQQRPSPRHVAHQYAPQQVSYGAAAAAAAANASGSGGGGNGGGYYGAQQQYQPPPQTQSPQSGAQWYDTAGPGNDHGGRANAGTRYPPAARLPSGAGVAVDATGYDHGYGGPSTNAAIASGSTAVTPGTGNALYFNDAHLYQRGGAGAGDAAEHPSGGYRMDLVSPSDAEGLGGGTGFFADQADSTSFRSSDRAHSTAMLGPAHVTSSFYGDFYPQSAHQPSHSPQQQQHHHHHHPQQQQHQQRLRSLPLSPASVGGGPTTPSWLVDNTSLSYGQPPGLAGAAPPQRATQSHHAYAAEYEHNSETTASSPQPPLSSAAQELGDAPQRTHRVRHPPPALTLPPPPQHVDPAMQGGDSDRVGGGGDRRSTHDYPPRRSPATILSASATVPANLSVQRVAAQPLRGTHTTGSHRAAPVASFAPDVVDPTPVGTSGGGNTRPATAPRERLAESVHGGAEAASAGGVRVGAGGARGPSLPHADVPQQQQQLPQQLSPSYRHPAHQQQHPPPRSPQLASASGSFRETVTSDVIEAETITVRVLQRKPSMARHSSYNSGGGGGAVGSVYRTSSGTLLGDTANAVALDSRAAATSSPAPMSGVGYGAMGVSPWGGVENMRDEAATAAAAVGQHRAVEQRGPHGMPYALPRTTSVGNMSGSYAGASALQRQGSNAGSITSPAQRSSQRMSHNPYTTTLSPALTPLPAAAAPTSYLHSGRGGGSGAHDFLMDAVDDRYGVGSDFTASAPVSPAGAGHSTSGAVARGGYQTRGGGGGGAAAALTTAAPREYSAAQRSGPHGAPRTAGDAAATYRGDLRAAQQQASRTSFYDNVDDTQHQHSQQQQQQQHSYPSEHRSGSYADLYNSAAADGTTQGFYFSMGDGDDSAGAARELYGSYPSYPHNQHHQQPSRHDSYGAHGGAPAPSRQVYPHTSQQRGGAGVYEDAVPMAQQHPYPQQHQQQAYHDGHTQAPSQLQRR